MTLTTAMATGLGVMLYVKKTQGLEKLDLNAPLNLKGALNELKKIRERVMDVKVISSVGDDKRDGK